MYAPAAFVTWTVLTPVASLRIVTVAPGTAAPCASVTTPLMMALSARCASTGVLAHKLSAHATTAIRGPTNQVVVMVDLWIDLTISPGEELYRERSRPAGN